MHAALRGSLHSLGRARTGLSGSCAYWWYRTGRQHAGGTARRWHRGGRLRGHLASTPPDSADRRPRRGRSLGRARSDQSTSSSCWWHRIRRRHAGGSARRWHGGGATRRRHGQPDTTPPGSADRRARRGRSSGTVCWSAARARRHRCRGGVARHGAGARRPASAGRRRRHCGRGDDGCGDKNAESDGPLGPGGGGPLRSAASALATRRAFQLRLRCRACGAQMHDATVCTACGATMATQTAEHGRARRVRFRGTQVKARRFLVNDERRRPVQVSAAQHYHVRDEPDATCSG